MADSTRPTDARPLPATTDDSPEWYDEAADNIVKVVGTVRDKTTGPALNAARWAVVGCFGAVLGLVLAVLLLIGVVRGLVVLTDVIFDEPKVWVAYLVVGVIICLVGAFLWRKQPTLPD